MASLCFAKRSTYTLCDTFVHMRLVGVIRWVVWALRGRAFEPHGEVNEDALDDDLLDATLDEDGIDASGL